VPHVIPLVTRWARLPQHRFCLFSARSRPGYPRRAAARDSRPRSRSDARLTIPPRLPRSRPRAAPAIPARAPASRSPSRVPRSPLPRCPTIPAPGPIVWTAL